MCNVLWTPGTCRLDSTRKMPKAMTASLLRSSSWKTPRKSTGHMQCSFWTWSRATITTSSRSQRAAAQLGQQWSRPQQTQGNRWAGVNEAFLMMSAVQEKKRRRNLCPTYQMSSVSGCIPHPYRIRRLSNYVSNRQYIAFLLRLFFQYLVSRLAKQSKEVEV